MALTKVTSPVIESNVISNTKIASAAIESRHLSNLSVLARHLGSTANTAIIQANIDIVSGNVESLQTNLPVNINTV